ncbi:Powdery mildew resistance protein [Hirschfeldia incana]|nr:Powdery mildew resistance protein [Hirschfeldia incana]
MLVLLITEVKKLRDFDHLFEDLVSTIEILVPITEEIDKLQERLDSCHKSLIFLRKTISRAQEMVRECSHVRKYDIFKKLSYSKQIQAINDDFAKFSRLYMPHILLLNQLRSQSRISQENSNVYTGRRDSFDEDEQRVILASFKDKGKDKKLQDQEDEQLAAALQESLNMEDEQAAKRRVQELEKDEQIANALLYDETDQRINGSSSSTRATLNEEDIHRMIWESFKK